MTMLSRREFIRKSASAAAVAAAAKWVPPLCAQPEASPAKADSLIILWMAGGMAHTETFDPKLYTPYESGLKPSQVLSTFPAIDTAVDQVKISAGLENLAKIMDRGTLIRTYNAGDLGFILHSRHQYHWHTGYAPPQTVAAPHLGAVVARTLGPLNAALPAFIDIGQRFEVGEGEELKAFHTAGFLGPEYGPFMIPDPASATECVRPPPGMSPARFENRQSFYKKLLASRLPKEVTPGPLTESYLRAMDNAHRLLSSPAAKAFDLSLEPGESYQKYNTGRFGLGCLLARRLVEAGARFIEVTTEYEPFMNWDTHENGHSRLVEMKRQIDRPIAQLILDLEEHGLLNRTLVVLASEFSRDMLVEGKSNRKVKDQVSVPEVIQDAKYYGMHRHFTEAGSVLLFGGGVKKGYLYGKTAEERPCKTIENPVHIEDLHATLYHLLGISPRLSYEVEKRPFYVTRDGLGQPIKDLLG